MANPEVNTGIGQTPVVPEAPKAVTPSVVPVAEGMKPVGEKPMGIKPVVEVTAMGVKAVASAPQEQALKPPIK